MKNIGVGIVAAISALLGCGTDESVHYHPIPQDEPKCLSCGYIPPQDDWVPPEPKPHMLLQPSELGFYYTLSSELPYPPQYVVLTNLTEESVTVNSIEITDDESFIIGAPDGAECFSMTPIPLPVVLQNGEQLRIEVWFSFTMRMHVALLTIDTSFDNPDQLVTELYGMVFNIE